VMRILHVIPSLSPTSGGPSFALPAMARALAGFDVQVTAVTTDDDGRGKYLQGITLGQNTPQGGWDAIYFRKQTEFYKASLPLGSWLRRHVKQFDAVHVHAVFSFASLAAGRAAAAAGVPYVVRPLGVLNRWGMENRRRFVKALSFRLFDLPMLRKASAMHYTSRMEMEDASRFGLKNLQRVIPIGMDLSPFDALPSRELFSARFPETASSRNILFLSRIDEKKGIDLLLEAFARIATQRPDILLVICGSGDTSLTAKLQSQAASLGIAPRVTWAGQVTGELRLAAFSAAEMFVLPSHSENFGIALLEAMAAGLPCISTDQVALALDAVRVKAVVLAAREPGAIAAKIEALLDSPQDRHRLGQSASVLSRSEYSLPAMGKALHDMYREIVKN
jgi:glycosyltransferase involved in cell wall biosynthesis